MGWSRGLPWGGAECLEVEPRDGVRCIGVNRAVLEPRVDTLCAGAEMRRELAWVELEPRIGVE